MNFQFKKILHWYIVISQLLTSCCTNKEGNWLNANVWEYKIGRTAKFVSTKECFMILFHSLINCSDIETTCLYNYRSECLQRFSMQ